MDAFETVVERSIGDAEREVRAALAQEGFGILSDIDVAGTLEAKLGVHRRALKILGACNPAFAHRALEADPALALLLPCNVVLEDMGDGRTRVAVVDPRSLLAASGGDAGGELDVLGAQAASSLERAIAHLAG